MGQYIWRLVKNRIWGIFCHWDENTWYISRGFSHMVNLSTYLKSLLHLANQPGQFQIKGGANSKFRIEQKPYIKNIKKCSELIIYDSWNFTTIKHICWFTSDSIKYIFDQASQYSNLSDFLSAGLYPIFGFSPDSGPTRGRRHRKIVDLKRSIGEWKAAVKGWKREKE